MFFTQKSCSSLQLCHNSQSSECKWPIVVPRLGSFAFQTNINWSSLQNILYYTWEPLVSTGSRTKFHSTLHFTNFASLAQSKSFAFSICSPSAFFCELHLPPWPPDFRCWLCSWPLEPKRPWLYAPPINWMIPNGEMGKVRFCPEGMGGLE